MRQKIVPGANFWSAVLISKSQHLMNRENHGMQTVMRWEMPGGQVTNHNPFASMQHDEQFHAEDMLNSRVNGANERAGVEILAHELRGPLSSILFALQGMEETLPEEEAGREMRGIVERQARHAAAIIESILDASCAAQGKLQLNMELVDLGGLIADALEITAPLLRKRGHCVELTIPAGGVCLIADRVRMRQVVANLLGNSAKYTNPGGKIWIAVAAQDHSVQIEIRDNGIGIPRHLLPRIFDLFQQGEGELHRSNQGLGIGLSLVKSLVEGHGGEICAHSDGEGEGSTFVVRLPRIAGLEGRDYRTESSPEFPAPSLLSKLFRHPHKIGER